jgi:uncharacterized protein (UPF0332 family)
MTRLTDCFERGLLRRVEASGEKAQASLAQAREWVDEAKKDLEIGAVRSALAAVYMGYFHAARAVLFRDGVREKSHYCIGIYLEMYAEKGLLEEEWVALFDHIRGLRQADQYSLEARPTPQEASSAIEGASRFIARMEKLLAIQRP